MPKKTPVKRAARRSVTSPNESRHSKFTRLAKRRLKRIVDTIILFGNLSSPTYESSDREIAAARKAIENVLAQSFARFQKTRSTRREFDVDAVFASAQMDA